MTNEQWDRLLVDVNDLIQAMERLPDPETKARVFDLLAGIDTIHREALRRLVRLFKEGVLEKVITDPAIHTLLELYDLLPPGDRIAAEQGPPGKSKSRFPSIPIKAVLAAQPKPVYGRWLPVLTNPDMLAPGTAIELEMDGHQVLLCRVADSFFAFDSRCARDGSSLARAALNSYTLSCPNHPGCLYDIRQGTRIAGSERLACHPVRLEPDGRVLVGLDMPFTPVLPSF